MKIDILSRGKKKFIGSLSDFGIKKIPQMLVRSGKEKNGKLIMSNMLIKLYSSPSVVSATLGIFCFL